MKKITLYIEDADGQQDKVTGFHVDHGDGSASWLTTSKIDDAGLRQIADDIKVQGFSLPKLVVKPRTDAPSLENFQAGNVMPQ